MVTWSLLPFAVNASLNLSNSYATFFAGNVLQVFELSSKTCNTLLQQFCKLLRVAPSPLMFNAMIQLF